jgi:hypothetical protein
VLDWPQLWVERAPPGILDQPNFLAVLAQEAGAFDFKFNTMRLDHDCLQPITQKATHGLENIQFSTIDVDLYKTRRKLTFRELIEARCVASNESRRQRDPRRELTVRCNVALERFRSFWLGLKGENMTCRGEGCEHERGPSVGGSYVVHDGLRTDIPPVNVAQLVLVKTKLALKVGAPIEQEAGTSARSISHFAQARLVSE